MKTRYNKSAYKDKRYVNISPLSYMNSLVIHKPSKHQKQKSKKK